MYCFTAFIYVLKSLVCAWITSVYKELTHDVVVDHSYVFAKPQNKLFLI